MQQALEKTIVTHQNLFETLRVPDYISVREDSGPKLISKII